MKKITLLFLFAIATQMVCANPAEAAESWEDHKRDFGVSSYASESESRVEFRVNLLNIPNYVNNRSDWVKNLSDDAWSVPGVKWLAGPVVDVLGTGTDYYLRLWRDTPLQALAAHLVAYEASTGEISDWITGDDGEPEPVPEPEEKEDNPNRATFRANSEGAEVSLPEVQANTTVTVRHSDTEGSEATFTYTAPE